MSFARAQQVVYRLAKASPRRLRGPVGRATRRLRSGFAGPLVTVVVPVSDGETTRIGTCLDSLKVQSYRNIEVLVVPYGAAGRVREIAREQALQDWRIRVRRGAEPSLAAARNAGIAGARGQLVIVARSGDDFVHAGIERMVESHQQSGSPLVLGQMRRPAVVGWVPDAAYDAAHLAPVQATDLAASPVAVTDLGLGNKLFSADLWRSAGLRFTDELDDGSDVALGLLRAAPTFDLISASTYFPTNRRDGVQVGTVEDVLGGLADWIADNERTWHVVEGFGDSRVRDWWLWGVLDTKVQTLIADVERADESQWVTLREHARLLLGEAGQEVSDRLTVESRLRLWLLQHDHRAELEDFVDERRFGPRSWPTVVRDGEVWAQLPFHDDEELGVPPELFRMSPHETRLRAMLREVRWTDAGDLELTVFAAVDRVHMDGPPKIGCALVERSSGARIELDLRQFRDDRANQRGRRFQDFSWGAFTATVPVAALVAGEPASRSWLLDVTVDVDGVVRSGPVPLVDEQGSATFVARSHLAARPVGGVRVGLNPRTELVGLWCRPDSNPRLETLTVDGRVVTGRLAAHPGRGDHDELVAVRVNQGGQQVRVELGPDRDFEVRLPAPRSGAQAWTVRALTRDGRARAIRWPAEAPQWLGMGDGEVVGTRTDDGNVGLHEARRVLVIDELDLDGVDLTVRGRWLGVAPGAARLELRSPQAVFAGDVRPADDGGVTARLRLTADPWGLGALPVKPGWYWFEVPGTGQTPALLGERAIERLHHFEMSDAFALRLVQNERRAGVELLPPIPTADRVPFGRGRLQDWYAEGDIELDPTAVYLQSYVGASATDSQLALHAELRRTRPDLTLYWGIASTSSWVPEGGVPLVMGTREWYHVLASAGHLCMNIDPDRWFRKRPGQRMLQTFHGYPAKSMGIRMWKAKGLSPRRVELELERTSRQWDLILTPAPEMDDYYRREYDYDGEIHNSGYPRDDVLVSDRAQEIREDTRRRLGIRDDQKAVLYAPTWRDDRATNWRAADAVDHLDVAAAAGELGPGYVLLMRGHRFHQPTAAAGGGTRFLDVTDYPEINDLILAADAAVLDYSSLRFDFALTRRPMVFLVPDLDTYVGGVRGFLYDYAPSAPGPHLDTAAQVVAQLRDIDGLRRRTAEELEAFHRRFNYLQDGRSAERAAAAFLRDSGPHATEEPA